MCGIAGVVGPRRAVERMEVEAMASALAHRGPDGEGSWSQAFRTGELEGAVAFGHRRLAILDLSPRGRQPMATADGRLTVAHNGEIYNFLALREQLTAQGHAFHTETDTEVLLAAYRAWGEACLHRFVGMFAFALWDGERRELLLARDRLGIKPLFYCHRESDGLLLFASELRALRRHPAFSAEIDRAALGRYLAQGCVTGPETIYREARRLMPGELLRWRAGRIEVSRYWSPFDSSAEPPGDFAEAVAELERLLLQAVRDRLIADVPLGAFLSGGVDSSTVVALMQEATAGAVRTFTIGFDDPAFDESGHARAVAEHLGTRHTELRVDRATALAVVHELPELFDEPFGDASAIPTLLVSRLARRDVTVALSGDGGDELFGGYSRYRRLRALERLFLLPAPLRKALATAGSLIPHAALRRHARLLREPDLGRAAERITARFPSELLVRSAGDGAGTPRGEYLRAFAEAPGGAAQRAMFADLRTYLADDILVKLDRATMSVGLEGRVPLLDHRVVRFVLSLPLDWLWRDGQTKAPLRPILHRRVPPALVNRPKSGFGFPVFGLLADELVRWTSKYFDRARLAEEGLLDPDGVLRLLDGFDPTDSVSTKGFWHLVCFERWFARVHRGERGD